MRPAGSILERDAALVAGPGIPRARIVPPASWNTATRIWSLGKLDIGADIAFCDFTSSKVSVNFYSAQCAVIESLASSRNHAAQTERAH